MLFLQLALLAVLLSGGDNADVVQEHILFHVIQISSFVNQSWAQNQGSGWLDELQTHFWDSESGKIIVLHPWSKGNFSNEELIDLELLFRVYFIRLTREIQDYASQFQFEYPFELQVTTGFELHSRNTTKGFFQVAYQGTDFLSFQNMSWIPSPEVRPEAWLSDSPILGSSQLLLVCHVSGFYRKPIWVMWMMGEQEQPGTQRGDVLPNVDGTWYLRVILNVEAEEAAGLFCQVRRSSLGDQDIILYWGHYLSVTLIPLAVTAPLILLMVLALWFKKRCSYQDIS